MKVDILATLLYQNQQAGAEDQRQSARDLAAPDRPTGQGAREVEERKTYKYICLCRKFPRLSCGDRSTKRHATIVGKVNTQTRNGKKQNKREAGRRRTREIKFTHNMTGNVSETAQNPIKESASGLVKYARLYFFLTL